MHQFEVNKTYLLDVQDNSATHQRSDIMLSLLLPLVVCRCYRAETATDAIAATAAASVAAADAGAAVFVLRLVVVVIVAYLLSLRFRCCFVL